LKAVPDLSKIFEKDNGNLKEVKDIKTFSKPGK